MKNDPYLPHREALLTYFGQKQYTLDDLPYEKKYLIDFFKSVFITKRICQFNQKISQILVLGCGTGDICFQLLKILEEIELNILDLSSDVQITGIDLSPTAIEIAKLRMSTYRSPDIAGLIPLRFVLANALDISPLSSDPTIILDNHLFHCLLEKEGRQKYLRNIKNCLDSETNKKGIFLLESLVTDQSNSHLTEMEHLELEKNLERKLIKSYELEEELLKAGFRIHYFCFLAHLQFVFHIEEQEITFPLVRIILTVD